jgi:hypothetical protein
LATSASGDDGLGGVVWNSPSDATNFDASKPGPEAFNFSLGEGQTTEWLKATNFGFTISPTATIASVTAIIHRYSGRSGLFGEIVDTIFDEDIRFASGDAALPTNHARSGAWPSLKGFINFDQSGFVQYVDSDGTWGTNDFDDGNGFGIWVKAHGGAAAEHPGPFGGFLVPGDGGGVFVNAIWAKVCWSGS